VQRFLERAFASKFDDLIGWDIPLTANARSLEVPKANNMPITDREVKIISRSLSARVPRRCDPFWGFPPMLGEIPRPRASRRSPIKTSPFNGGNPGAGFQSDDFLKRIDFRRLYYDLKTTSGCLSDGGCEIWMRCGRNLFGIPFAYLMVGRQIVLLGRESNRLPYLFINMQAA
jgi:hypothetical protein